MEAKQTKTWKRGSPALSPEGSVRVTFRVSPEQKRYLGSLENWSATVRAFIDREMKKAKK